MSLIKKIAKRFLKGIRVLKDPMELPTRSAQFNEDLFFIKTSAVSQLNLIQQYRANFINNIKDKVRFEDTGFSLFSQHEEDGMLLFIFSLIGTTNKKCVEVCAGNGIECNTANLIINHKWIGLMIDGHEDNIKAAKEFYSTIPSTRIWPPEIIHSWITIENINPTIKENGFEGEIDLLSLDIDGIDYWLWKAIEVISPRVIVLEFNHLLGPDVSLTVPYKADFKAEFTEFGSDYAGASLQAFIKLGKEKGYRFIGANSIATNAFFIRNDIKNEWLPEIEAHSVFHHPRTKFGMEVRYQKIKDKEWTKI
jgi:hypothetical protein